MSQHSKGQPNETNGTKTNSHDLAFTLMQDSISYQTGQVDALDNKANAVLVAASAVLGSGLVLQASLIGLSGGTITIHIIQVIALIPMFVAYAYAFYYGSRGYSIMDYERVPAPSKLLEYVDTPEDLTKLAMLQPMKEAFDTNKTEITKKAQDIEKANRALYIETILLIVTLLFQVLLRLFIS